MNAPEKRTKSEKDEFLGLFWKLSNPDDVIRISAAENIVNSLLHAQERHKILKNQSEDDESPWCSEVKYAITRLLQGLASERKASRLGFSCALTHLLTKLDIDQDSSIQILLSMASEKLKSSKEKGAEKGSLLGKVFAHLAVIHSCKLDEAPGSVKIIFEGLMKLSKMKSYLRTVCFHGVSELVRKVPNTIFDKVIWKELSEIFSSGWESCDAEIFEILQTCCRHQSETCGKTFLKANEWIGKKSKKLELIGPHSFKHLGKMLPATTSCHPRIHPLCHQIAESVARSDRDTFRKFWKEAIETGLLDSSPERKYLALKLSIHILPMLNDEQVSIVWSTKVVSGLMYIFSNKTNPLHSVCKSEIVNELCEQMKNENVSAKQQLTLLYQFLTSPAGLFLDDNTNTRCVGVLAGSLHLEALCEYIAWLRHVFATGKLNREGIKEVSLDTARRWSLSQLSQLVRNHRLPREDGWILPTVQFLFLHYHFIVEPSGSKRIPGFKEMSETTFVPITDKTREHLKHCLAPAINAVNSAPSLQKDGKVGPKFHGTASDGEFWISKLVQFTNALVTEHGARLVTPMDEKTLDAWSKMVLKLEHIKRIEESDESRVSEGTSLRLLLAHVGIKLINGSEEEISSTCAVLTDLFQVVDERFGEGDGSGQADKELAINWVEIIIETILGMLSQNSRSIRSVADQVFKLLSAQLTRKGLHLILDVLDPARSKEILENNEEEDDGSDEEGIEEEESSDSDDSAFDDDEVSEEVPQSNQFRKKVKEALGEAADTSDEEEQSGENKEQSDDDDDSGPEMDDEAMMRIDRVLAEVFRQKKMTKKKLQEDSHKQLLVFQLRCLDLIEIMASRRHSHSGDDAAADSLILEAVRPLLVAVQHASRTATDMTLAEKASVLLRVKICKMKRYPKNLSRETVSRCHDDIDAIMAVAYHAPSVFMCQLASDCCLFLLRVLCGNAPKHSEDTFNAGAIDVERIQKVYKGALENFMTRRESHLQACVIQDFITRFPALAADLAPDVLKYVKDGILIYRRSRACFMLHELVKNAASRTKCKQLLFQITSVSSELVERASDDSGSLKTKYYVELMRLYHQAVVALQSAGKLKSLNTSVLIPPLEKFLQCSDVVKSQELTSWTWRTLHGLGVERDSSTVSKKKGKKRMRGDSEGDMKPVTNGTTTKSDNEEITESKKDVKARVLKEKKERKKKVKKEEKQKADNDLAKSARDVALKKKKRKKGVKETALQES